MCISASSTSGFFPFRYLLMRRKKEISEGSPVFITHISFKECFSRLREDNLFSSRTRNEGYGMLNGIKIGSCVL